MRADLLKNIAAEREVTHVIILTHNIDFVFLQTVVLSAMKRCGHPTLTVFADAGCALESYAYQYPVLKGLGGRYRVVPVEMERGFRFHPKVVLLSGSEKASLFVGSGNLTFGGWRENGEVWIRHDTEADGTSRVAAFREYLTEVTRLVVLPEAVEREVAEAFDPATHSWAGEMEDPAGLLGRAGVGGALIDRISAIVVGAPLDLLTVCAPYYDEEAAALKAVIGRFKPNHVRLLVQPEKTTLTRRAFESLDPVPETVKLSFLHILKDEKVRRAFAHAKFYAFTRAEETIVLAGSANCSRSAWLIEGERGNAELLTVLRMDNERFERDFLAELMLEPDPVELPKDYPKGSGGAGEAAFRILAARQEADSLTVAYAPERAEILECSANDQQVSFRLSGDGVIRAQIGQTALQVRVAARIDGDVHEARCWVDRERELRSTARGRTLGDALKDRIRPGQWSIGAYSDVLDILWKNLKYLPDQTGSPMSSVHRDQEEGKKQGTYTVDDLFAPDYGLPICPTLSIPAELTQGSRVRSLQQLLLRWFGVPGHDEDADLDEDMDEPDDDSPIDDSDEAVDVPERIHHRPLNPRNAEVTEKERRRVLKMLGHIRDAMTSHDFLERRSPDQLATDLKLTATLLRAGLREGWIEVEEFFDFTHAVWSSLFFTSEGNVSVGWIEQRVAKEEDKESFIAAMRSPALSAALAAWAIAIPKRNETPKQARFVLASALGVARLPWLWHGGEPDAVARELAALIFNTSAENTELDKAMTVSRDKWEHLLRTGYALACLIQEVDAFSTSELRSLIRQDRLEKGELLWQGSAGICIVTHSCSRGKFGIVKVLRLQGKEEVSDFKASFTIPMRSLLSENVLPLSARFGKEQRRELDHLIGALSKAFASQQAIGSP